MMESERLTQDQLAEREGKDQSTIAKYLALLESSPRVWENMNRFIKLGLCHFPFLWRMPHPLRVRRSRPFFGVTRNRAKPTPQARDAAPLVGAEFHFEQINRIEDMDEQWKFAEITLEKDLSVRELTKLIDAHFGVNEGKKAGRPKGVKTLGDGDIHISGKGQIIRLRTAYDRSKDLEDFLDSLRRSVSHWINKYPLKTKPETKHSAGNEENTAQTSVVAEVAG